MSALDVVNRVFREFRRYTGDGLPGEPVAAPLPVGDPSSGVNSPKKSEIRSALLEPIAEATAAAELAQTWAEAASVIAIPNGSINTAKLADGSVTDAKVAAGIASTKIAYTATATGADATTVGEHLNRVKWVEDFGVVADVTFNATTNLPVTGSGTDQTAKLQDALNWLVEKGGTLKFRSGVGYRQDGALTLLNPGVVQNVRHYTLDFDGCCIVNVNATGTKTMWTVGAADTNAFLSVGGFTTTPVIAYGPELVGWDKLDAPSQNVTFWQWQFAGNVEIEKMMPSFYSCGIRSLYSFPLCGTIYPTRNIIGLYLDDASNNHDYQKADFTGCRFGAVMVIPNSPTLGGKINCINFHSYRFENCEVGCVIDPGNGSGTVTISNLRFAGGYNNAVNRDVFRIGTKLERDAPELRTPDVRLAQVQDVKIEGGIWNSAWSSTRAAIVYQSNGNARQVEVDIPVPFGTSNAFVDKPLGGRYRLGGQASGLYARAFHEVYLDTNGLPVREMRYDGVEMFRNGGLAAAFFHPSGSATQVGNITTSSSATAFNTSSDALIKDDRGVISTALARGILRLIAVHEFTFKEGDGRIWWGFFAQELYDLVPNAVTPGSPPEDFGTEGYQQWSVDMSKIVPYLVAGWQDLDARLAALEALGV